VDHVLVSNTPPQSTTTISIARSEVCSRGRDEPSEEIGGCLGEGNLGRIILLAIADALRLVYMCIICQGEGFRAGSMGGAGGRVRRVLRCIREHVAGGGMSRRWPI
jgi:hypothetical protein